MTLVNFLSLVAFILIAVVLVVRMPSIVSEPSSRLAWLAALFGCAAFACVGVVVPLDILDGWLGGTNVVNLLQNVFATAAFWFIMQASRTLDGTAFDHTLALATAGDGRGVQHPVLPHSRPRTDVLRLHQGLRG